MKKIVQRLLMFVIGLPAVLAVVAAIPQFSHLAANILVTVVSGLGAVEFSRILGVRGYRLHPAEAFVLGALAPLAMTLTVSLGVSGDLVDTSFIIGAAWVLASRILRPVATLEKMAERAASGLAVIVYPGVFMLWIIRLSALPEATALLVVYLLAVFSNDSLAWVFGMLLGGGNRGIVPASPNKSAAGFAGGIAASIGIGALAPLAFPAAFAAAAWPAPAAGAILGGLTGAAGIIGDLAESTVKRSAEVKDSGTLIPGRGGVLDSIDSLAFAAPVFFLVYTCLF
jgi:phosphatidate cytidylyltransferase